MDKQFRVLIVEDEENIAMAVRTVVSKNFKCEKVDIAKDGEDAWNLMQADYYDLVIADWNMPRKTGYELLSEARQNDKVKDIPFLMLTARSDKDSIVTAIQGGVSDYLVKPFEISSLIQKIGKLLKIPVIASPFKKPDSKRAKNKMKIDKGDGGQDILTSIAKKNK